MNVQAIALVITLVITIYLVYKGESAKPTSYTSDKPDGRQRQVLDYYSSIYKPIPPDERLATLDKEGWELEDIAKTATEIIYDEPIPNDEAIKALTSGDYVKLKFIDAEGDIERMWVEYVKMEGGLHRAILRNTSFETNDLVDGRTIWFHPNHVFMIDKN